MTKSKVFIAQVAILSKGTKYTAAGSGIFDPGEIAQQVLPGLRGGQLFAYLFRRFGYPSWGWDEYKNLVSYLITTPLPEVFLSITPYMGSDRPEQLYDPTDLMFGYCVDQKIEKQDYYPCLRKDGHAAWEEHPRYKACQQAFEAAMRDLLRPVYVRDVPINCYGRVDDDDEQLPEMVEHYHAAGYPIPLVLFEDTTRWEQFWDALSTLGNGDYGKGMEAVIKTAATIRLYEGESTSLSPEEGVGQ